jgi:hypothetical protein
MWNLVKFIGALALISNLRAPPVMAVRQQLELDPKYIMGWDYDAEKEEIIFDVKVETKGYVGFGLNFKSDMNGADIVIGGVDPTGKPYFSDRHGTGKFLPTEDEQQDWVLISASETETHTLLKFSRPLNTCDNQDMVITKDTLTIIWSFGATDDLNQHIHRGGHSNNFLDPIPPPVDLSKFKKWEIRVNDSLPEEHTSYLCSFHRFEAFPIKHHAVGMNVYLENKAAIKHTHHFAATQCRMDDTALLDSLIGKPALNCEEQLVLFKLKPFCRDLLFGWGTGGGLVLLPEHVGISVKPNEVYYVMLEMHYDNPQEETGVQFTTGFDAYFSDELRENEGSIMMVGAHILPSLIIPPNSKDFVVAGHCSENITKQFIPPEGVNIVSINLHSHLAGRKMRIRHFRNNVELPWLQNDENYDFNYQQTRELAQEIKLMPGDHLTMECTYDTTWREDVTLAGESTRQEMCHAFVFYYPKIRLNVCRSGNLLEYVWNGFGIEEIDPDNDYILDPTIKKPTMYANKTFSELLNSVNWTSERRIDLEKKLRFSRHWSTFELSRELDSYPPGHIDPSPEIHYTKYPVTSADYVPEPDPKCLNFESTEPTTTTTARTTTTTRTPGDNNAATGLVQSAGILLLTFISALCQLVLT